MNPRCIRIGRISSKPTMENDTSAKTTATVAFERDKRHKGKRPFRQMKVLPLSFLNLEKLLGHMIQVSLDWSMEEHCSH